eukprot:539883_1
MRMPPEAGVRSNKSLVPVCHEGGVAGEAEPPVSKRSKSISRSVQAQAPSDDAEKLSAFTSGLLVSLFTVVSFFLYFDRGALAILQQTLEKYFKITEKEFGG